jgi:hypothetical protein
MSSVVTPASFKTSNVTFSPVKTLDSGGRQAYLNYNGGPLMMQVGPLETRFGMSVFDKQPGAPPKYSVDLNLRGHDDPTNQPKTAAIYEAFHALDEFMLDQGVKNSAAWFKGQKSRDVLSELYTPTMRFAVDSQGVRKPYPPSLKIQLRKRQGKFDMDVFDDKKRPLVDVPLEDVVVKGAVLTVLIKCTGIWFAGGKYGLSWKAEQISADKVPQSFRGKAAFVDEDGEVEEDDAPTPSAPSKAAKFATLHDEDEAVDDEEALSPAPPSSKAAAAAPAPAEEEEDEEAPPPVPVKKVVKKVVKKAA